MDSGYELKKEEVADFIQNELSASERIALKRCCGKLLKDANAKAATAFYKVFFLPDKWKERLFAVACMRCLWSFEDVVEYGKSAIPFEMVLRKKRQDLEQKDLEQKDLGWSGMERRLIRLFDRRWDRDGLLCADIWRMVEQMKRDGYMVDMVSLGMDLCRWNWESKWVQQRWLQVCYSEKKEEKQDVD